MKEITPYLMFSGNCREAMEFYQKCTGGELSVMTYGEMEPKTPPDEKHWLIHARLAKGSTVLMASDSHSGSPVKMGNNVWLSFTCETDDEVAKLCASLGAGGKEIMAPHDAFWGARFAMVTDRFGVNWMLNHEKPSPVMSKLKGELAAAR